LSEGVFVKRLRNLLVLGLFVVSAVSAEAQCLSQYNTALRYCDATFGGSAPSFTIAGCRADAWAGYYTCIGHSILD
jgi:hypothetical protein